ncbi:hypothetical protein ScPMuIL_013360 [Solemya velum]
MERLETDPPLESHSRWYVRTMSSRNNPESESEATLTDGGGTDRPKTQPNSQHISATNSTASDSHGVSNAVDETGGDFDIDETRILQAVVFLEDAAAYRSIYHKIDKKSIVLYRFYFSLPVRVFRYFVILLLHSLAFIEFPSSLSWSSDIRTRGETLKLPCGTTEGIEILCIFLLLTDVLVKGYLIGYQEFLKKNWMIVAIVIIVISLIDWLINIFISSPQHVRIRRMLRPFFLLHNSSLMKKTVNCLRRTVMEIISVLMLLALHLYVFTLLGMLMFPTPQSLENSNSTGGDFYYGWSNSTPTSNVTTEGSDYFRTLSTSFMNLLILLTTANNPDVTIPAYQKNRFSALFFIVFLIIGLYCFMNMLTAIIYNQFRGYFMNSMQASLFRRRLGVRASFEMLCRNVAVMKHHSLLNTTSYRVAVPMIRVTVEIARLPRYIKTAIYTDLNQREGSLLTKSQFTELFEVLDKETFHAPRPPVLWSVNRYARCFQVIFSHIWFYYFGSLVACINVIMISVELATQYDKSLRSSKSSLNIVNFVFIVYYVVEQSLKLWAVGWRRYLWDRGNVFDAITTVVLAVTEIFNLAQYGYPIFKVRETSDTRVLWNVVRIINILIMVRLLRIIAHIKAMNIVASTLIDLVRNLRSFGGILVVIYYSYALIGIEIFRGAIKYSPPNSSESTALYECGTYQQLEYWANNFDDFAAAIVVLWDIMVVNNWHVFLNAYADATSKWSYIYFIIWWLLSVVIALNLFTALILENFIMKWDKSSQLNRDRRSRQHSFEESQHFMSVHDMFRGSLQEPDETELDTELRNHRYLKLAS